MTTTAAEKFASLLPTTAALTVRPATSDATGTGYTATLVGAKSAEFTAILADTSILGGDGLAVTDLLTPAIDAAAKTVSVGVLSDVVASDTYDLSGSDVYELVSATGVVGWFAVTIRDNAGQKASGDVSGKLNRINDVELALTVEIGHTRMSVRDFLSLEPGAVVELDRAAGSPADIKLNGKLIAHGQVVVIDQDFAVRITNILKDESNAA